MAERKSVWVERFEDLKTKGVDRDAAQSVFALLDQARAFGNQHNAQLARDVLNDVWPEANAGSINSNHAGDRYLVVITEQEPYAFAVETLEDAAAALNRETPVWGGFVLERTEDGSSYRSADVYLDDDTNTYVVGEG